MKKFLTAVLMIAILAVGATWFRFQSFDPCIWMEQELAEKSDLPRIVIKARIKAEFLLEGISEPTPPQCVVAWWRFRMDGVKPPIKGS